MIRFFRKPVIYKMKVLCYMHIKFAQYYLVVAMIFHFIYLFMTMILCIYTIGEKVLDSETVNTPF
ncbi:unnamed protein product [Camellia sinensis]